MKSFKEILGQEAKGIKEGGKRRNLHTNFRCNGAWDTGSKKATKVTRGGGGQRPLQSQQRRVDSMKEKDF